MKMNLILSGMIAVTMLGTGLACNTQQPVLATTAIETMVIKPIEKGMSTSQVREILGEPDSINDMTSKIGKTSLWIYPTIYVFFQNDEVFAFNEVN